MGHLNKKIVSVQNTLFEIKSVTKFLIAIAVKGDNREFRSNNSQFPEVSVCDGNSTLVKRLVEFIPLEEFGGHVGENKAWGAGYQVGIGFPVNHSLERD